MHKAMNITSVREYLEAVAGLTVKMDPNESLVLKYGQAFPAAVRHLPEGMARGPMGKCFDNCAIRAMMDPSMTYCEGFAAVSEVIMVPIYHAWLKGPDGTIYDPTWIGGTDYYGIEFDTSFVLQFMRDTGYMGVLGNRFRSRGTVEKYLHKKYA